MLLGTINPFQIHLCWKKWKLQAISLLNKHRCCRVPAGMPSTEESFFPCSQEERERGGRSIMCQELCRVCASGTLVEISMHSSFIHQNLLQATSGPSCVWQSQRRSPVKCVKQRNYTDKGTLSLWGCKIDQKLSKNFECLNFLLFVKNTWR